jgi:hypothetical protein
MTVYHGLRRALSASLLVSDAAGVLENATLLEGQPDGDLRTFLSRTYADGPAVERAFCDAGGTILSRVSESGALPLTFLALGVDAAGRPVLNIGGGGKGTMLALRFAIPHSSVG